MQFLAQEPLLADAGILVLEAPPVQLPAGIGTEFIVASVVFLLQFEVAMSPSVDHLYELPFQEVPILVVEFHVQRAAQLRRPVIVGRTGIGGKPEGVAQEIARVVHVQIDLLLGNVLSETREAVHEGREPRVGLSVQRVLGLRFRKEAAEQQERACDVSSHKFMCNHRYSMRSESMRTRHPSSVCMPVVVEVTAAMVPSLRIIL